MNKFIESRTLNTLCEPPELGFVPTVAKYVPGIGTQNVTSSHNIRVRPEVAVVKDISMARGNHNYSKVHGHLIIRIEMILKTRATRDSGNWQIGLTI